MREKSARHREFLKNCEDILASQDCVSIDAEALDRFAARIAGQSLPSPHWNEYVSASANAEPYDFPRAFFEMAMIVANQGGFLYADRDGAPVPFSEANESDFFVFGKKYPVKKWNIEGSGAAAMVKKMAEIREKCGVPGIDFFSDAVDEKVMPLLQGVPYAEARMEIFREWAAADSFEKVRQLLETARTQEGYHFGMEFVDALSKAFPKSFGEDPLLKKALLAPMMACAHAESFGLKVDISDLPIPADYILPMVLNSDNVAILKCDKTMTGILERRDPMHQDSRGVRALRAAAVLICDRLVDKTGLTPGDIDAALWVAGRQKEGARPHMVCFTMRF